MYNVHKETIIVIICSVLHTRTFYPISTRDHFVDEIKKTILQKNKMYKLSLNIFLSHLFV